MIKLYMVQPDTPSGLGATTAYLPYAAGLLTAAALRDPFVARNYSLGRFVFIREDIDAAASSFENPGVVGFSNYCWNTNYNRLLAAKVKELYPDCAIIFGGHNVPPDTSMLEVNPFIDFLIYGEGENPFTELLRAIASGGDFSSICNIAYRDADGRAVRTPFEAPGELTAPSPYLTGLFDPLIAAHPDIRFNAILETNRGCPNRCAYCDWGLLRSRTRTFPLERVFAEIKWMSDNKIDFVWGADANFGLFERDDLIADELVRAKESAGYPKRVRINYSKNSFDRVFSIVHKFKECELDRVGATLSFQSLSPEVLENIGRKNMSLDFFSELLSRYRRENLKAYSELILGLPGETYQSFTDGLSKLLEMGQHFVFEVFECMLLPNSTLATDEYIKRFSIKTVTAEMLRGHCAIGSSDIPEYCKIIVETASMSRRDWVRATMFSNLVKVMHGNGLLRIFAIYLFYEMNVPYGRFYDGLLNWFESNPSLFSCEFYGNIREDTDTRSRGETYEKRYFLPYGECIWDDNEYLFLNFISDMDRFYADMLPYLRSFGIADDVFDDLLAYQRAAVRTPFSVSETLELSYDLHPYFTAIYEGRRIPFERRPNRLTLTDTEPHRNWKDFGRQVVWFGLMGFASYKDRAEEEYV